MDMKVFKLFWDQYGLVDILLGAKDDPIDIWCVSAGNLEESTLEGIAVNVRGWRFSNLNICETTWLIGLFTRVLGDQAWNLICFGRMLRKTADSAEAERILSSSVSSAAETNYVNGRNQKNPQE